jgi:hypothetical protein
VLVPDAPVATMPPTVASAPGSTEKKKPVPASAALSWPRVTPACTVVRSPGRMASTAFICEKSTQTPPSTANRWPSIDEPTPNGMIGTRSWAQARTTKAASSVSCT